MSDTKIVNGLSDKREEIKLRYQIEEKKKSGYNVYSSMLIDRLASALSGVTTVASGIATFDAYQNDHTMIGPYILGTAISVIVSGYFYMNARDKNNKCKEISKGLEEITKDSNYKQ